MPWLRYCACRDCDDEQMQDTLYLVGVLQLASAALFGWVLTLQRTQPEFSRDRLKIIGPRRIMQLHLDQVMMGLILLAVGSAFPELPDWIAIALLIGTVLNPLLFLPLAFWPKLDKHLLFRAATGFSFIVASTAFVALAIWVAAYR